MSAGEDDLPRQRVQGGEDATLKGKVVALNHFDKFLSSAKCVGRELQQLLMVWCAGSTHAHGKSLVRMHMTV